MANKRIRNYDDGAANVANTDSIAVDRAGLDELERVTLAQAVTAGGTGVFQPLDADLTALAGLTDPATKLAGIEAGADVTDAANVAAAGALMDGTAALDDLADVTITTPSSGQVLKWNGSAWVNDADATGGGTAALDDLADVTITTPADNEVLAYNSGTSTWINQTAAEAGLAAASHNHDATYQPLDSDLTAIAAANNGSVLAATTASFTTADESKLDGIEAGADVTDETNVVAALSGATTTGVTPAAGDKVLLLDASDSDNVKHALYSDFGGGGGGSAAWFGDGIDGDVTVSSNTTLAKDMYYDTLTVNSGVTVTTGRFRIFAKTAVVNNGTISANGGDSPSHLGGTGATGSGGLGVGYNGGTNNAAGTAAASPSIGGAGGTGGLGSTASGLAGGAAPTTAIGFRDGFSLTTGHQTTLNTSRWLSGGAGGGSGGRGDASGNGGGGGGGGGIIVLAAPAITNNGTISANGGSGGTSSTANSGGGGGGGGGGVLVLCNTFTGTTPTATGGAGGAGNGTGATGSTGTAGTVVVLEMG